MEPTKSPFQSVTLWTNLILALLSFVPAVKEHVTPDLLGTVFALANAALRFKTKSAVSFK